MLILCQRYTTTLTPIPVWTSLRSVALGRLQWHGRKRVSKKQTGSCKKYVYYVLGSNCSCFSLLSEALRWICLIQELFLLR